MENDVLLLFPIFLSFACVFDCMRRASAECQKAPRHVILIDEDEARVCLFCQVFTWAPLGESAREDNILVSYVNEDAAIWFGS